jgi:lipocalin-like protein
MVTPDSSGGVQPYWDDRPLGLIVYTSDGHVSAQLYDARRGRLGARWTSVSPDAARSAYAGLITYFGTYTIDAASQTVTHLVEGAMSPDWIGTKLVRAYRFLDPNRLELRTLTSGDGARAPTGTVLIWERLR